MKPTPVSQAMVRFGGAKRPLPMCLLGRLAILSVVTLALGAEEPSPGLELAIGEADVDWDNCIAWGDGSEQGRAPRDILARLLGLKPNEGNEAEWTTPPLATEVRHFRIVFRHPILAGTLCTNYASTTQSVSLLKPEAASPGTLDNESIWDPLPAGVVKALPSGSRIRALRLTHRSSQVPWEASRRPSAMGRLLLIRGRFWDPARLGGQEWSVCRSPDAKESKPPPKTPAKSRPAEPGPTDPIDQWIGFWPREVPVAALALLELPGENSSVACLQASPDTHPLLAEPAAWKPASAPLASRGPGIIPLPLPVPTRAVRLLAPGYRRRLAQSPACLAPAVLVPLRNEETTPSSFIPTPPFTFQYDMPLHGSMAVRISDSAGRHVRRLIAEVERRGGAVIEPWDLKDDAGVYVPPGSYRFDGVARPPLKLTYEMTVYSAGHPPWFAPVPGGGGWMSDHSPPRSVCAVNDRVFLGSGGAEYGVGTIATDLDGNKVWSAQHLVALRLITDGRYAYAVNSDSVVRIDPEKNFALKTVHTFQYSDDVPGHADAWIPSDWSGVACHGGRMYVSYNAPPAPWIVPTMKASEIDLPRCFPPPSNEKTHETAYNPTHRILGTFLTIKSSTQAYFGDTVDKGPLRRSLLLSLTRELPVGTVLLPRGDIRVYALRPGKSLPPELNPGAGLTQTPGQETEEAEAEDPGEMDTRFEEDLWVPLRATVNDRPDLAVPDQGLRTRALLFTAPNLKRIDYSLVLNRRFRNATPDAETVLLEGQRTPTGGWVTTRAPGNPISSGNPAVAGLLWKKPVPLRGAILLRPMEWSGIDIDVWDGPPDATITSDSFRSDVNWRRVGQNRQVRNHIMYSWHTNRVIDCDFGGELGVRALRVRVMEAPAGPGGAPVAVNGGFEGLITFQPIGRDAELPKTYSERVTVLGLPKADEGVARVERHVGLPKPGALAFDREGTLYAVAAQGIVRIRNFDTQQEPLDLDEFIPRNLVKRPRGLALDEEGVLYVLDGDLKQVRVFDPKTGRQVRAIGTAGGAALGPFDPTRFSEPVSMALDRNGKLWVVEQYFQPKRISRWSRDGTFEKDFLGPTHYGGGGVMDPGDRTVINHLGMKFRIDYGKKTWRLEARLRHYEDGTYSPDRVTYVGGRRYLVGDHPAVIPFGDSGPTSVICEEKGGVAVPLVAAGLLSGWRALSGNEGIKQALGRLDAIHTSFVWTDLSRDGTPQAEEVRTIPGDLFRSMAGIGEDLSLNFMGGEYGYRLRVQEIRADGLPLYDVSRIEKVPGLSSRVWVTPRGETFVMGHRLLDRDGKRLWSYPDRYMSVQGSNQVPWGFYDRPAGVLAGGLLPIGHFEIASEQVFCVNGNNGDHYAFTGDGLLVAAILGGPTGYGRRFFSIPDCEPGKTDLSDLRKTVEDFQGHVCRANDGNVYALAGKSHITVIRVDGLERMQRRQGSFDVRREDIQAAMVWETEKARVETAVRTPRVFTVPFFRRPPKIDGDVVTDWPQAAPMGIHIRRNFLGHVTDSWEATLGFDTEHLYLAAKAVDPSPMVNSAVDRKRVFQYGDGVDLQIGLDAKADPARTAPVPGDIRMVFSRIAEAPVAMVYRYQVSGAAAADPTVFTSPVGETRIDEIRELKEAQVAIARQENSWFLEAAIPWKALGHDELLESLSLRGDVGALESDPNGVSTVARHYWSNRSNVVMSDLPAEARVVPALWGEFRFVVPPAEKIMDDTEDDAGGTEPELR